MPYSCGAASLAERLYARQATRSPAAPARLICTTASDSEGTLGGLAALSELSRLAGVVTSALHRAAQCWSDPVCAGMTTTVLQGAPRGWRAPVRRSTEVDVGHQPD